MFGDLISLIYPRNCAGCGNSLFRHEDGICNYCYLNLPKTHFHSDPANSLKSLFNGRADLEVVSSFYIFHKKGTIQKILHAIKYRGSKELAVLIGRWYARDLADHPEIRKSACIIPVPLHPLKYRQRGYNQSEEFGRGLAGELNIPLNTSFLKRTVFTSSQTRKNRFERWENVEDKFEIDPLQDFKHQYVILVDDVITTGATIEACCQALRQAEGIKIHVLSMAYTGR